ncbi:MAG: ATP synthase F0 subunit B [Actinobacteria bacterium]|nr:ATP synthase F0 subunit B [Actinomycetota bacterium]
MSELENEDAFEVQMRGYARRQVDEFVARSRSQTRDLEERLSRALDEVERLRNEVTAARQAAAGKPVHEEISERVGQILKLADDEAKAQRSRVQDEIGKQRDDAKQEADRIRAEARDQTERMLKAAQEQAENAIAAARTEADKLRNSARAETERAINEAHKKAESTVASATAQAKQMLDEATTRATAIHDGAERRLNLLMSRHTETLRRLTEIRDVVTNLVSSEVSRGSLEEEVAKSVAAATAAAAGQGAAGASQAGAGQPPAPDGRHANGPAPAAAQPRPVARGAAQERPKGGEAASAPAQPAQPASGQGAQHRGGQHVQGAVTPQRGERRGSLAAPAGPDGMSLPEQPGPLQFPSSSS